MVRTLDTNVLVRLFVIDDSSQTAIAEELVAEPFLLLPSVLAELMWVLTSRYKWSRENIVPQLNYVLGLETATVGSANAVAWALQRYAAGADFADMLHFALAEELEATSFATFDKRIKPHQVEGSSLRLERLA